MSILDQAKKEAKRLYQLAKKDNNVINIKNIDESEKIIANINGYDSWKDFELLLQNKDTNPFYVKENEQEDNIMVLKDIDYFNQTIPFNTFPIQSRNIKVVDKIHEPILLSKINKKFLEKEDTRWILNQYPLYISGSYGAGRVDVLLSLAFQYIKNEEGLIYFTDRNLYHSKRKLFSYIQDNKRLDDFYLLSFDNSQSNTIDPINPMVGDIDYFIRFFGDFGHIINDILIELHDKGQQIDIDSLESILMLNNLIEWNNLKTFKTNKINYYLESIGYESNTYVSNEVLMKHSENLITAYFTIRLFKEYSTIFKINPDINIEHIFMERKILVIDFYSLKEEKNYKNLSELLAYQIKKVELMCDRHFQNIVFEDCNFLIKPFIKIDISKSVNNYILSDAGLINFNSSLEYAINVSTTKVIMKNQFIELPDQLKLFIMDNAIELPNLVDFNSINNQPLKKIYRFLFDFKYVLINLKPGQAYILCNNENLIKNNYIINNEKKFYFQHLTCIYIPIKKY